MKNIALPAVALCLVSQGTAFAADGPLKLNVGATVREFLVVADQDQTAAEDLNTVSMHNNVRLFAKGSGEFENGLKVDAYIRFEAIGRKSEDVDEAYIDFSSAYGTLRVGEKEGWNAVFMGDPAPSAFLTTEERVVGDGLKPRNGTGYTDTFTFKRFHNDAIGVQYRTPEFQGLQVGVSYHPRTDVLAGPTDRTQVNNNSVDVSASYKLKFDGGQFKVVGGYIHIDGRTAPGAQTGQEAWNIATSVTTGEFTLGGAVLSSTPQNGQREWDYTGGAMWAPGPWKLSADYAYLERRPVRGAVILETTQQIRGQVAYKIGPGLEAGVAAFHTRQKDATGAQWDGLGAFVGFKIEI